MVALDSDTILTASDEGLVRLLNVHPTKLKAVIGSHAGDEKNLLKVGRGGHTEVQERGRAEKGRREGQYEGRSSTQTVVADE